MLDTKPQWLSFSSSILFLQTILFTTFCFYDLLLFPCSLHLPCFYLFLFPLPLVNVRGTYLEASRNRARNPLQRRPAPRVSMSLSSTKEKDYMYFLRETRNVGYQDRRAPTDRDEATRPKDRNEETKGDDKGEGEKTRDGNKVDIFTAIEEW